MKPLGVGLDLVEVERVRHLLDRKGERVMIRLLTDAERAYCAAQPVVAPFVAARLAAKEATYKALQVDGAARAVGWREIELTRGADGAPALTLHGRAADVARRLGVARTMISVSHTDVQAAAIVLLLG